MSDKSKDLTEWGAEDESEAAVPMAEEVEYTEEGYEAPCEASVSTPVEALASAVETPVQEASVAANTAPSAFAAPACQPMRVEPDCEPRYMRREREGYAGTFRLAPDEYVVSMYRLLRGSKRRVGGRAYLTNRRFLLVAGVQSELPVEKVQGVSSGKSKYVRVMRLIVSLLLLIVGIAMAALMFVPAVVEKIPFPENFEWLKYIVVGVGGILAVVGACLLPGSIVRRFVLSILASDVSQPISIRSGLGKGDRDLYTSLSFGRPGPDYKKFRQTFGARLLQVKDALAHNRGLESSEE